MEREEREEREEEEGKRRKKKESEEQIKLAPCHHEALTLRLFRYRLVCSGIWQNTEEIVKKDSTENVENEICPKNPIILPPVFPRDVATGEVLISRAEGTILTLCSGVPVVELPRCCLEKLSEILPTRLCGWGVKAD